MMKFQCDKTSKVHYTNLEILTVYGQYNIYKTMLMTTNTF